MAEWRHSGIMVSVLSSGLSIPGSSPDQEHGLTFLGKTHYFFFCIDHYTCYIQQDKYPRKNEIYMQSDMK